MRKLILLLLFCSSSLYSLDNSWIEESIYKKQEEAKKRGEEEAWFKETLKKTISDSKKYDVSEIKKRTDEILAKSVPCKTQVAVYDEYNVYIVMTFDLPENVWVEYSRILEKIGGCFVVRGLPNDSFVDFAKRVKYLRDRGVTAPIQLNPKFFQEYEVELSPTILLVDGKRFDKISGIVTLSYALEQFQQYGDTSNASVLRRKISGGFQ